MTMRDDKAAKWRRSAHHLRYEIFDARSFRRYQAALYWAMNRHPGLEEEDGGLMVQSIIHVYEEYKAMLIRRITKESERAGGVSLIGLLKDLAQWPQFVEELFPQLPPHAAIVADLERLEAAVRPINNVADMIYAHVDPRPAGPLFAAFTTRDQALDLMLELGETYVSIIDEPLPDEPYDGPTEHDIRELFGTPWITEADQVPRFGPA
jgi:hypothetical protein